MLYSKGVMDKEFEYHQFPNVVCALLPQIPNVRIKLFKITDRTISFDAIQKTAEYEEISRIINYETSNHETSCFMLFCNVEGNIIARHWALTIETKYNLYFIQVIIHI